MVPVTPTLLIVAKRSSSDQDRSGRDEMTCVSVRGGTGGFRTVGIVAPAEVTSDLSFSLTNNLLDFKLMNPGDGRLPSAWPCNHTMWMLVNARQGCSMVNTHDGASIHLLRDSS